MQLIVAEKPEVARAVAHALGVAPHGETCFEDARRILTWCVGHLVDLEEPEAYDPRWAAFRDDLLPIVPRTFRFRPLPHAPAQLRAVCAWLNDPRVTEVVNACDPGREGERVFRWVYGFARARVPVRRLWVTALTPDAIREGLEHLRDPRAFDALAEAAASRAKADWLVGINASRALASGTLRNRIGTATLSAGRVQTPILAMVVERERARHASAHADAWVIRASLGNEKGATLEARSEILRGREQAETVRAACERHGARVVDVRTESTSEPPPLPFDLATLQFEAGRRFGLSAQDVLDAAQSLYERREITYPRTDSRHLPASMRTMSTEILATLRSDPRWAAASAPARVRDALFDDTRVGEHHAIVPLRPSCDAINPAARAVHELVVRGFLASLLPDAHIDETYLSIESAIRFEVRTQTYREAGWREVLCGPTTPSAAPRLAPEMLLQGHFTIDRAASEPSFTDGTLVRTMATLSPAPLGTAGTRSASIETLIARGLLVRESGVLLATEAGRALVDAVRDTPLASASLTASWEARLANIAAGNERSDAFLRDTIDGLEALVRTLGARTTRQGSQPRERHESLGDCPRCAEPVRETPRSFACVACGWTLPRYFSGRGIPSGQARKLLANRRSDALDGFKTSAGRSRASLVLRPDGSIGLERTPPARSARR